MAINNIERLATSILEEKRLKTVLNLYESVRSTRGLGVVKKSVSDDFQIIPNAPCKLMSFEEHKRLLEKDGFLVYPAKTREAIKKVKKG